MMSLESFQDLPVEEVSRIVRACGPKVCVFPINGTRRWFLLESKEGQDYLEVVAKRHIEVYRMLFDHGLDTLLAPMFGPDLLERGSEYVKLAVEGLARLATHPDFLTLYREHSVRVRFYGDYRKLFSGTPYEHVLADFEQITAQTLKNDRGRLFFGVFANNATQTAAELAVRYFSEHGKAPDESQMVELYYGEPIAPASLFIGFDKFSAFDMPLIATDNTDLYFTASPSLYLTERGLRAILYDHVFTRCADEPDYEDLSPDALNKMKSFYRTNVEKVFGLGALRDGIWYPSMEGINPGHFS